LKLFLKNGNERIGDHGAPDLRLDYVLSVVQKLLDAQMLGVVLGDVVPAQRIGLIAEDAATSVHLGRVHAADLHVALRAGHKEEGACLMHLRQANKVQVAPVHDVGRAGLQNKDVQHGVRLDGCPSVTKCGPFDQAQAEVYGASFRSVGSVLELQPQVLAQMKLSRTPDQNSRQVGPSGPAARLVGIGHSGAVSAVAKAHRVQLACIGARSHFCPPQAIAETELGNGNDAKWLGASQAAHTRIGAIASKYSKKTCPCKELHDRSRQGLADIHRKPLGNWSLRSYKGIRKRVSNRHQIESPTRLREHWLPLQMSPV